MATLKSLVSLAEIKEFIETKAGYTGNDALYQSLALKATKMCEQYTRRQFTEQAYTEYFGTRKAGKVKLDLYGATMDGYSEENEVQKFFLRHTPISTTADFNVYFDLNRVWAAESELSTSIYWVDYEAGILSISTYIGKTDRTLKVTYTAGYEAADVDGWSVLSGAAPEDLKLACLITVVNLFNRQKDRTFGLRQQGDSDDAPDFAHYGMIPPEAREILLPYKKTYIGKT